MAQTIRLYLDENIWRGLTEVLQAKGYDVLHAVDAHQGSADDEAQLAFATEQGRAILTYNIRDFAPLAVIWYEAGREHAGIILSRELPRGEFLRRIETLLANLTNEDMYNTVWFYRGGPYVLRFTPHAPTNPSASVSNVCPPGKVRVVCAELAARVTLRPFQRTVTGHGKGL